MKLTLAILLMATLLTAVASDEPLLRGERDLGSHTSSTHSHNHKHSSSGSDSSYWHSHSHTTHDHSHPSKTSKSKTSTPTSTDDGEIDRLKATYKETDNTARLRYKVEGKSWRTVKYVRERKPTKCFLS